MPPLTAEQLATLTHQHPELATFVAVLYIPHTGQLAACPNITAPLHACPNAFDVPHAARLAAAFHDAGIHAHLLVYGIPWNTP